MSMPEVPPALDQTLVTDVRALLEAFRTSGAHQFETVIRPDVTLTLSRLASGERSEVRAPHVGTALDLPAPGTRLSAGDKLMLIAVLDSTHNISIERDCVVEKVLVELHELLEFGRPVAIIRIVEEGAIFAEAAFQPTR